jgi:hypothetical protein
VDAGVTMHMHADPSFEGMKPFMQEVISSSPLFEVEHVYAPLVVVQGVQLFPSAQ